MGLWGIFGGASVDLVKFYTDRYRGTNFHHCVAKNFEFSYPTPTHTPLSCTTMKR